METNQGNLLVIKGQKLNAKHPFNHSYSWIFMLLVKSNIIYYSLGVWAFFKAIDATGVLVNYYHFTSFKIKTKSKPKRLQMVACLE